MLIIVSQQDQAVEYEPNRETEPNDARFRVVMGFGKEVPDLHRCIQE